MVYSIVQLVLEIKKNKRNFMNSQVLLWFGSDAHHARLHQCCVHLICFMFLVRSSL